MAKGTIKVREQKDGILSYDVIVSYKDSSTSKWRQIWKTAPSIRKAQALRTKLLGEVDKGIFSKPSKITLGLYLEQWLSSYVASTVAPRTFESYSYISKKHLIPALGNIALCNLRPLHLQRLYADKLQQGLSPRTVQLLHVTLHKAFDNAIKTGLLSRNPIDAVDQPKVQRHEIKVMAEDDITLFLNEAKKGEYYALFFLFLFTGLRRNEALSLRWIDIDLLGLQLSVNRSMEFINNKVTFKPPKTGSSRRLIALTPSTAVMLRLHREAQNDVRQQTGLAPVNDNDLVFCRYNGMPLRPDSITHAWTKLVRRCGLSGVRLHDARHTHASLLLKQGVHPKVVQERLGHASIAITLDTYSHTVQGMQKAAAAGFDDAIISKVSQSISLDSH
jgi:integrase